MTTIEQIYNKFKLPIEEVQHINARVEDNRNKLRKVLKRKQRRLVLRIVDDKDLVAEITNYESFRQGFKLGVKLGAEIYCSEDADDCEIVDGIIMG